MNWLHFDDEPKAQETRGTTRKIWYDIIILDEIVFLRFLRKNGRLLLDFKNQIKCETSLGFVLDRL